MHTNKHSAASAGSNTLLNIVLVPKSESISKGRKTDSWGETDSVGARQRGNRYRFKHTADEDKQIAHADTKTNPHVHIAKLFCWEAMLTQCQDSFMEFLLADSSQTADKVSRWEKTKLPQPAVYSPTTVRAFSLKTLQARACSTKTRTWGVSLRVFFSDMILTWNSESKQTINEYYLMIFSYETIIHITVSSCSTLICIVEQKTQKGSFMTWQQKGNKRKLYFFMRVAVLYYG